MVKLKMRRIMKIQQIKRQGLLLNLRMIVSVQGVGSIPLFLNLLIYILYIKFIQIQNIALMFQTLVILANPLNRYKTSKNAHASVLRIL